MAEQLHLIPPPPFAPIWPAGGLALAALGLMLEGCIIDHPTFERATGSWRLAAAVNQLRAAGWPVASVVVPDTLNDGTPRQIARYRLPAEAIMACNGATKRDYCAAPISVYQPAQENAPERPL